MKHIKANDHIIKIGSRVSSDNPALNGDLFKVEKVIGDMIYLEGHGSHFKESEVMTLKEALSSLKIQLGIIGDRIWTLELFPEAERADL